LVGCGHTTPDTHKKPSGSESEPKHNHSNSCAIYSLADAFDKFTKWHTVRPREGVDDVL
jgi:hypothetical protein